MKTNKKTKKLTLNKTSIAHLGDDKMKPVKGGFNPIGSPQITIPFC
jgi:natural product precursor